MAPFSHFHSVQWTVTQGLPFTSLHSTLTYYSGEVNCWNILLLVTRFQSPVSYRFSYYGSVGTARPLVAIHSLYYSRHSLSTVKLLPLEQASSHQLLCQYHRDSVAETLVSRAQVHTPTPVASGHNICNSCNFPISSQKFILHFDVPPGAGKENSKKAVLKKTPKPAMKIILNFNKNKLSSELISS